MQSRPLEHLHQIAKAYTIAFTVLMAFVYYLFSVRRSGIILRELAVKPFTYPREREWIQSRLLNRFEVVAVFETTSIEKFKHR
jgi:hypothetical protein